MQNLNSFFQHLSFTPSTTSINIIYVSRKKTYLTASLDIGVDTWMSLHSTAIKICVWKFVIKWIVMSWNSGNFREILPFILFLLFYDISIFLEIYAQERQRPSTIRRLNLNFAHILTSTLILTASVMASKAQIEKIFINISLVFSFFVSEIKL